MSVVWQEQIRATEPLPKHEHVVENILRDKADGWRHDYYNDPSTGYDIHVARSQAEVDRYKVLIKKYDTALNKLAATLDASKKDPTDPGFKKLTQKEAESLETEYTDLYKLKCEQLVLLDGAGKSLQELEWKQYLQKKRLALLHMLRNTFMLNGDADYMTRGVTWVEEYIARQRQP
jgi:hypothetical protein